MMDILDWLLFHPMKWQSEEHVGLAEAAEWARHFGQLEQDMDSLLAHLFGVDAEVMREVFRYYVRKFVGDEPPSGIRVRRILTGGEHHIRTYRVRTGPNHGGGLRSARMRVKSNVAEIVGEAAPHVVAQLVWQRASAIGQRFFNDGRRGSLSRFARGNILPLQAAIFIHLTLWAAPATGTLAPQLRGLCRSMHRNPAEVPSKGARGWTRLGEFNGWTVFGGAGFKAIGSRRRRLLPGVILNSAVRAQEPV
jgi:hypothetical protein